MGHVNPDLDRRQFRPGTDEYLTGADLLRLVRDLAGDTLLLQFSCGKESVAMWLWLRSVAPDLRVVPYWLYLVPGLGYQERAVAYYEEWFGQHIIRLPHPALYQLLARATWQTPETIPVLAAMDLQQFDFAEVERLLAEDLNLDEPFTAVGMRRADFLERMRMIDQMGVVGIGEKAKRRFYYPIWDWKIDRVGQAIQEAGIKLPVDYEMFGRTVTALNYRRLIEVKRRYPEDYAKILDWFPLAELEIFRYEQIARPA